MNDVQRSLGRIEGRLDHLIDTLTERMQQNDTRFSKIETRVGKVEKLQHWYAGFGAAIGAVVGAILALFGDHRIRLN